MINLIRNEIISIDKYSFIGYNKNRGSLSTGYSQNFLKLRESTVAAVFFLSLKLKESEYYFFFFLLINNITTFITVKVILIIASIISNIS